jgi:hypothetical protein
MTITILAGHYCTCRLAPVHCTDIDPPDMIVDRHCPAHGDGGPDPDEAYERKRDDDALNDFNYVGSRHHY